MPGIVNPVVPPALVVSPSRPAALEKRQEAPVFLNEGQAAELLGVSRRKFHDLRASGIVPAALALGERCLRWRRDELLAAVTERAPRVTTHTEPAQLQQARRYRDGREVA